MKRPHRCDSVLARIHAGLIGFMESIQGMIDGLKSATYEIGALLLPGVVLIAVSNAFAGTPQPDSTAVWLVVSYVVGLVLQGLAALAHCSRWLRWISGGVVSDPTPAERRAREIVEKECGKEIAEQHLLDFVLTRVYPNRQVYDKFLALADTTRALALVAFISIGLVAYGRHAALDTRTPWLTIAGFAVAWLALQERHRRFSPLAYKALYGKFIALQGKTAETPASNALEESR